MKNENLEKMLQHLGADSELDEGCMILNDKQADDFYGSDTNNS